MLVRSQRISAIVAIATDGVVAVELATGFVSSMTSYKVVRHHACKCSMVLTGGPLQLHNPSCA